MMKRLKVGFIIHDQKNVATWYLKTIQDVLNRGSDIHFIYIKEKEATDKQPFMFRLFEWFENKWFQSEYDARQQVSIEKLLTYHNTVDATASPDILKDLDLDLLYSISPFQQQIHYLSEYAKYGLWFVHFGYGKYREKASPAFWEVMDNSPVTGSYLLALVNGKLYITYEGTTRTIPHSVANTFNSIAWKSSSYLGHRLEELKKVGNDYFKKHLPSTMKLAWTPQLPNNIKMPVLFVKNVFGYLKYKVKEKFQEGLFTIHYSFQKFQLDGITTAKFESIPLPSKDVFYADPFVIEKDDIHYIFFEEMVYSKGKAHISLITIDEKKQVSQPRVILDMPFHLSYPFVFEYDGAYYMIPETSSNKTVQLYRAISFPSKWEFVMNLMEDVILIDVTLYKFENRWWLFANSYDHAFTSTNDQLFLFSSDNLFSSEWVAHPHNPIATHAENCRPAGRIFKHNDKLFRPAQNNASQQYGYGLKINEIEILNEESYKEREILSITPDKVNLKACHQIDFSSSLIVIDGIPV